MNSYQCYRAYLSASKIMDIPHIPFQARLRFVKLKKLLEEVATAYEHTELDIVNRYGDKNEDGSVCANNGFVSISSPEKLEAARITLFNLRNELVDQMFPKFEMPSEMLKDLEVQGTDIENLLPFIDFGGDYED